MSLNIHNTIGEIPEDLSIAYFQKGYFQSQSYNQFLAYSNEDFFIPFDITHEKAISIPRSPFASLIRRNENLSDPSYFVESFLTDLTQKQVQVLGIQHPSSIYELFVPKQKLIDLGLKEEFSDINQHIELSKDWENSIHDMQQRKLTTLRKEGFEFRKMHQDEFETAHKFLTICRQAQGLQINIEWSQLKQLTEKLPATYECFGVFREKKISALCITVNVTSDIAYYYLPATSPMFRDKSPMVLLIAGLVEYYRNRHFKILDLGVSSFQGKPQETLKMFKQRMGAIITDKPTLTRFL